MNLYITAQNLFCNTFIVELQSITAKDIVNILAFDSAGKNGISLFKNG